MHSQPESRETRTLGIFDSGCGVLTVLKALSDELPNEDITVIADTARAPYGNLHPKTVNKFSFQISGFLFEQRAKCFVQACNTITAISNRDLSEIFNGPVVGMIKPALDHASNDLNSKRIAVICTQNTKDSGVYERVITELTPDGEKVPVLKTFACPLLVSAIERHGWTDNDVIDSILVEYLTPVLKMKPDTLIFGCTHFPLARTAIERFCKESAIKSFIDPAKRSAKTVHDELHKWNLLRGGSHTGRLTAYLTSESDVFRKFSRKLRLNVDIRIEETLLDRGMA